MSKQKILYIGWCMPYDTVGHAGGQIFNHYVKKMSGFADVSVISIALQGELEKATLNKYGIADYYLELDKIKHAKIRKILSINSKINPWHKYGHIVTSYKAYAVYDKLKELKKEGYRPDKIVLQWTQMILLIDYIKQIYSDIPIIAIEEDVTYLRLKREAESCRGLFKKIYLNIVYENEKKREIRALKKADLIYVNNKKDEKLLLRDKLEQEKIKVLVPFFHKSNIMRNNDGTKHDILFYGNMGRPENYNAAIWFIEKVMPQIDFPNARFIIMGGNSEHLKRYECENVILTGYVDDVDTYFANSDIFVAPITMGAGIKIKVLEAMSSGIPVITTKVGIEGIFAENGRDYIYYDTEEQLVSAIKFLFNNRTKANIIGENGKKYIIENFDYESSVSSYINTILRME